MDLEVTCDECGVSESDLGQALTVREYLGERRLFCQYCDETHGA